MICPHRPCQCAWVQFNTKYKETFTFNKMALHHLNIQMENYILEKLLNKYSNKSIVLAT